MAAVDIPVMDEFVFASSLFSFVFVVFFNGQDFLMGFLHYSIFQMVPNNVKKGLDVRHDDVFYAPPPSRKKRQEAEGCHRSAM